MRWIALASSRIWRKKLPRIRKIPGLRDASYEELEIEPEEILDLGNGVILSVVIQKGRPVGSSGHVQLRYAIIGVWVEGAFSWLSGESWARTLGYRDNTLVTHVVAQSVAFAYAPGGGPQGPDGRLRREADPLYRAAPGA